MALYTVFGKREYDFVGRDGENVTGYMYSCFDEENNPIEFSSSRSDIRVEKAIKFEKLKSVELDLEARVFGGRVKFRETRL